MEQSPSWEANSHSGSQEVPRLLWDPKVHYRVHNSPPIVPVLSQMHPIHIFPPHFHKIHSNIIFLPTVRYSQITQSFDFGRFSLYPMATGGAKFDAGVGL
jgi:hypothetical protein